MKGVVFFISSVSVVYLFGVFVMTLVALSDYFVGIWRLNYTEPRHDAAFHERLICIFAWPFVLVSRKGRKLFASTTKNIF
jgi:hypothetical protein